MARRFKEGAPQSAERVAKQAKKRKEQWQLRYKREQKQAALAKKRVPIKIGQYKLDQKMKNTINLVLNQMKEQEKNQKLFGSLASD